nr:sigma-70 family RNA polymerase sigma factor [uncultured Allomuricauda sp.]
MKTKVHRELEKIFYKHYEEWCFVSYSYLKDKSEAEEIVQDVCAKLLLNDSKFEIRNLKSYITIAVKNNSIQRAKKLRKFVEISESKALFSTSIEEKIISKENQLFLKNAVESLPELSKNVFNLCVLEGEKYQNVAETLGISVNTVKYHMKKSYKILRANMQNTYFFILYIFILLLF